jgi:hypothetical protein
MPDLLSAHAPKAPYIQEAPHAQSSLADCIMCAGMHNTSIAATIGRFGNYPTSQRAYSSQHSLPPHMLSHLNAFALFIENQRKWDNSPLDPELAKLFITGSVHCRLQRARHRCKEHGIDVAECYLPHGSYLVNLAHPAAGWLIQTLPWHWLRRPRRRLYLYRRQHHHIAEDLRKKIRSRTSSHLQQDQMEPNGSVNSEWIRNVGQKALNCMAALIGTVYRHRLFLDVLTTASSWSLSSALARTFTTCTTTRVVRFAVAIFPVRLAFHL